MKIATQCNNIQSLLKQIYRGNTLATLQVYGRNGTPIWDIRDGSTVTLKTGDRRLVTISKSTYNKIEKQLEVVAE